MPWRSSSVMTRSFGAICALFIAMLPGMAAADSVNLIKASCGAKVPLDSLFPIESYWSLRDLMEWRNESSAMGLSFAETTELSHSLLGALERVSGISSDYVTLFELDGTTPRSNPECAVFWDPREVLYISTTITSASVAMVPYGSHLNCPLSVSAVTSTSGGGVSLMAFPVLSSLASAQNVSSSLQQTIIYHDDIVWPVSLTLGAACRAFVVLAVNRHVALDDWWTWIPAVVYTAVVVPIALFSALSHRKASSSTFAFMVGAVYIGYLGVSVGLMISIAGWQVAMGRYFPFPSSVTLYICLWVGYAAVLPLLLARHPCCAMLVNAVVRSMLYGLFAAQMVAYWVLGFVAIASVGLGLVVAVNCMLIFLYARFVSLLSTSKMVKDELRSMPMSWLAPLTPFVPSVLLYADLFFSHHASPSRKHDEHLQKAVLLFNLQSAVPFILFFEGGMIALLIAATVRQPTFLVALFITLSLALWYTTWTLQQYMLARSEWFGSSGDPSPTSFTLWPAIHALVDKFNVDVYHARVAHAADTPDRARRSAAVPPPGTAAGAAPWTGPVPNSSSRGPPIAKDSNVTGHQRDTLPAPTQQHSAVYQQGHEMLQNRSASYPHQPQPAHRAAPSRSNSQQYARSQDEPMPEYDHRHPAPQRPVYHHQQPEGQIESEPTLRTAAADETKRRYFTGGNVIYEQGPSSSPVGPPPGGHRSMPSSGVPYDATDLAQWHDRSNY